MNPCRSTRSLFRVRTAALIAAAAMSTVSPAAGALELRGLDDAVSGKVTIAAVPERRPSFIVFELFGPGGDRVRSWTERRAPYVFNGDDGWASDGLPDGAYQLKVRTFSNSGQELERAEEALEIRNRTSSEAAAPAPSRPTAPANDGGVAGVWGVQWFGLTGDPVSGRVRLGVQASGGVVNVRFTVRDGRGVVRGRWLERSAPYEVGGGLWDTTGLADGRYEVEALVRRPSGRSVLMKEALEVRNSAAAADTAEPDAEQRPATDVAAPRLQVTDTSGNPDNRTLGWGVFDTAVGQTSSAATFNLRNTGNAELRLEVASVTGDADAFRLSIPTGASTRVRPNQNAKLEVRFRPRSVGSAEATVELRTNVPGEPSVRLKVTGKGLAGGPTVAEISPRGDATTPEAGPDPTTPRGPQVEAWPEAEPDRATAPAPVPEPAEPMVAVEPDAPASNDAVSDPATAEQATPPSVPSGADPDARRVVQGDHVVRENGAVVRDLHVTGAIIIEASDVTVLNCRADRLWHKKASNRGDVLGGLRVADCEFVGSDAREGMGMVLQRRSVVERTTVRGHKDGIYFETGGPGLLSHVEVDIRSPFPDNHSDAVTLSFVEGLKGTDQQLVIEHSRIWAEGKTAAFNQQGIPLTVRDTMWSGSAYTCPGSRFLNSAAKNPKNVRHLGKVVPWKTSWEVFHRDIEWDVVQLTEQMLQDGLGGGVSAMFD